MSLCIEYQPKALSYDEFHRLDRECFPQEPIQRKAFVNFVQHDFWAAYESLTLVGYSYMIRKPDVSWLSRIAVAAEYRDRGIAAQMMQSIIEHSISIGLPEMILYVRSDNIPAIRLYEGFGFTSIESAYQYVLPNPQQMLSAPASEAISAVPINLLAKSARPQFPREWANLAEMHNPPEVFVLVFRDQFASNQGYCRLNPQFPGCFPFVVDRPSINLLPTLQALRSYLLPEKESLILTFSDSHLAITCTEMGLKMNYQLFKMFRLGSIRQENR